MRIRPKSNRPTARLPAPAQALLRKQGFGLMAIMIAGCLLGFSVAFALIRVSQENVRADHILVQKQKPSSLKTNSVRSGMEMDARNIAGATD